MRYSVIDYFRFFAIILMIIYHIFFDYYLILEKINLISKYNFIAYFIGSLFIFTSGLSIGIKNRETEWYLKRFLKFLIIALIISFSTYILYPNCYIKFGIIHFFAFSIPFIHFFNKYKKYIPSFISISFLIILFFRDIIKKYNLFFLGFYNNSFCSLDYYPLFPMIYVYLIAIYISDFVKDILNIFPKNTFVEKVSKNSLLIYLLHQPIIYSIIFYLVKYL